MAGENAKIDNNYKKTLTAVTDDVSAEIRRLLVDPTTGRLKVSAIVTTGGGLSSLNGLTADTQLFAIGTTGTDFGIVSGTATHTFNLPSSSAVNRGLLTAANWSTFNNKVGSVATANGVSGVVTAGALTITLGVITPTSVNGLTLATAVNGFTIAGGTTSKTLTVPLDASVSGTNTGDNTNFAAPLSGTINEIAYFNSASTIASLAVATYPSLTELSYVKGLSSAVQTQITAKAGTALSNLASVAINITLVSDTDNTDALGTTAIAWSDLFLGSGAVITFNSAPSTADITITHALDTLTFAGGTIVLGTATATGGLTGNVTGNVSGTAATVTGAAQTAITSLGTLTALQVDNLNLNGNVISSTDTNGNITLTPNGTGYTILNGNVGIGTTSPASIYGATGGSLGVQTMIAGTPVSSSYPLLSLINTSTYSAGVDKGANIAFGAVDSAGSYQVASQILGVSNFTASQAGTGYLAFRLKTASLNVDNPSTEVMRITSSGNVGIGTTGPDKVLEINLGTASALRLTYNDANGSAATYMDTTVSSVGLTTFTAVGSAPAFAFNSTVRLKGYAVASLPAGVEGDVAYVTDQITGVTAKGIAPVAGGAFRSVVFFNGTIWVGI